VTTDREGSAGSGSGLGLAIVRELATAMGATVHAESPLVAGAGTRMVVELQAPGAAAG
jgi:signal transduction histidine kinase